MAVETFWAVPAQRLHEMPAFRARVAVDPGELVYLDTEARVWSDPVAAGAPIYEDSSPQWRAICSRLTSPATAASAPVPAPSPPQAAPPLPLHRWNTDFEWRDHDGRSLRLLDRRQVELFDRQGWIVLEGAVPQATVDRLIAESDAAEREGEEKLRQMRGGRGFIARADEITFTTHLVNRSPFVRRFYASELFRNIGHDLIGPDVRLYWDQAVYKKPGVTKAFPWHQDNGYTFVDPQDYLTCWIGLNEANERNGCMWMVPGVHRLGTVAHELTDLGYICYRDDPPEAVPVPTGPGAVIVLSSLTPHKTGANVTRETRRALVAQLVPDGAVAVTEDAWGKISRTVADRPDRQFKILAAGAACE